VSLLPLAQWLEATAVALWVRESLYGFPIVVAAHLLSLTVSVGLLVWFDLRLLGVSMLRIPVSSLYRRLMPWILAGFTLMFASGVALLAAYATAAFDNLYFRIKLAALVLAGANALFYNRVTERQIRHWDEAATPASPARAAGLISIALWAVVIVSGRMMSYTMF
jgi:hypothetical protein